MKIGAIDIYQHELPVRNGPYTMSNSTIDALDTILVRIRTDNGITGWGETCPLGLAYANNDARSALTSLRQLAPKLVGQNITDVAAVHDTMNSVLAHENYAKAAIDIACYDALGKLSGRSVAQLLGNVRHERVPSYYAVGLESPDAMVQRAVEKKREGFPRLQIKAGGRPVAVDIEVAHKVHEAVGSDTGLVVDPNRGWSQDDAVTFSRACAHIPLVIEQPCKTAQALYAVRKRAHHKIFMDENAVSLEVVEDVASCKKVDGFSMKVTRLGGLYPMRTFRDLCATHRMPHTCDDSWGGDIIAAACVHVGATVSPKLLQGVWIAAPYIDHHYDRKNGIEIEAGYIKTPSSPGLGIEPDVELFGHSVYSTD